MNKFAYLCFGFLILCLMNILMLMKFPVYPDEINWLVNISRYNIDQGKIYHYMKPCFSGFIEAPFYLKSQLMLLGLYSNISNGFSFRLIPLIITSMTMLLFYFGINKISKSSKTSLFCLILLSIAIFGSAGSIWNATIRAENWFSLYIVMIFFFISYFKEIKPLYKNIILIIFIYSWTILSIAHPKGLYYILIILALVLLVYKNLYVRILLFIFLTALAYFISVFDYSLYINCKAMPEFNYWMSTMNINPLTAITNPSEFGKTFFGTIGAHLNNLLTRAPDNISFHTTPSIGLLPSVPISFKVSLVNLLIKIFFIANIILSILFFIRSLKLIFYRDNQHKELLFLLISSYVVFLVIILFNRTTNNYDIQFWNVNLTLINLIFLIVFLNRFSISYNKYLFIAFLYMCLSTHIFHNYYYKVFVSDWNSGAHAGPNAPLRYFTPDAQRELITDFNSKCLNDLDPDLILFDDRTYIPLNKYTGRIAPFTYTALPYYNNNSLENGKIQLSNFLSGYKSVIMYASCAFKSELPYNFQVIYELRDYSICCYNFLGSGVYKEK